MDNQESLMVVLNDFFRLIFPHSNQVNLLHLAEINFNSLLCLLDSSPRQLINIFQDEEIVHRIQLFKMVVNTMMLNSSDERQSLAESFIKILLSTSHDYDEVEYVKSFMFNQYNSLVGQDILHVGSPTHVDIDPNIVLKIALQYQASSIVIVHSHIDNHLIPSPQDLSSSIKLQSFLKSHDIWLQQSYIYSHGQLKGILK